MNNLNKFDGVDYANTFAKRISVMHELVKNVLSGLIKKGYDIVDIGGGPGIGARMVDEMGIEARVINIEPSTTIYDVPGLSLVTYIPLKMSFKEALDSNIPYIADCLMLVSSEHEIALCNGSTPIENKKMFLADLNLFIRKHLKKNGYLVIGFPNYRKGASMTDIAKQRRLTESLLGHSHPPEEFFTIDEFLEAFGPEPVQFIQKPMDLTHEDREDTALMANVAVFKIMDP